MRVYTHTYIHTHLAFGKVEGRDLGLGGLQDLLTLKTNKRKSKKLLFERVS